MTDFGWASDLKKGSLVAVHNPSPWGFSYALFTVERTTPTLVILENGSRWRKDTRHKVPAGSRGDRLTQATAKIKHEIARYVACTEIERQTRVVETRFHLHRASLEQLQAAAQALKVVADAVEIDEGAKRWKRK